MYCRIADMREKQVICIKNGAFLGCVGDVEVDTCSGKIVNIVVYGRPRFFGIFGRCDDTVLPWDVIEVIGKDAMLVNFEAPVSQKRRARGFIKNLFSNNYIN